ncbi:hypothetical protein D3C71_1747850 [compost metagenome]
MKVQACQCHRCKKYEEDLVDGLCMDCENAPIEDEQYENYYEYQNGLMMDDIYSAGDFEDDLWDGEDDYQEHDPYGWIMEESWNPPFDYRDDQEVDEKAILA